MLQTALVGVAEPKVETGTNLPHAIKLQGVTAVGAPGFVGDVDAFSEDGETVGNFILRTGVPLLVLLLITRLRHAAGEVGGV